MGLGYPDAYYLAVLIGKSYGMMALLSWKHDTPLERTTMPSYMSIIGVYVAAPKR